MATKSPSRLIAIRLTPDQLRLLKAAAALVGLPLSAFVRTSALEAARESGS